MIENEDDDNDENVEKGQKVENKIRQKTNRKKRMNK